MMTLLNALHTFPQGTYYFRCLVGLVVVGLCFKPLLHLVRKPHHDLGKVSFFLFRLGRYFHAMNSYLHEYGQWPYLYLMALE